MKKSIIAAVLLLVFGSILTKSLPFQQREEKPTPTSIISQPTKVVPADYFSYVGEQGKNALELLNENTRSVERDQTGLVVSINGRKADSLKREYWAFYVDGKLAEVGPAYYQTKNGDRIEWKMEKY